MKKNFKIIYLVRILLVILAMIFAKEIFDYIQSGKPADHFMKIKYLHIFISHVIVLWLTLEKIRHKTIICKMGLLSYTAFSGLLAFLAVCYEQELFSLVNFDVLMVVPELSGGLAVIWTFLVESNNKN